MRIILVVATLLLSMAASAAGSDIFKCQRPDGSVYFSDKPDQRLDDCRMERVEELPSLGTLPESMPPGAAPPIAEEPRLQSEGKSFAVFKSEAVQLVEQFKTARRQSLRASYQIDKQSARRELTAIRERKDALLREIDGAALGTSEKAEIRELLSGITE